MRIRIEKRLEISPAYRLMSPAVAIGLSLLLGAALLMVSGFNPIQVYRGMWRGAFGDSYGLAETVVKAIPIMLCALGVALAFRMLLWNIGAEGQFMMGAIAASWVALRMPHAPAILVIPLMVVAGMIGGGLWALLPGIPRALLGVNEIITSLMLNYVAIYWLEYLIHGPWKDPRGWGFPLSAPFSEAARLPSFGYTRIHLGIVFAVLAALAMAAILSRTRWGYEIRVIGESPRVARYAGVNIVRNIIIVMIVSGALSGLAGMAEVSAIAGRLQRGLSPGYGYSAIIVAWLAKLNPYAIIIVSFLFGGLLTGGYSVQVIGVPAASVSMLQGAMLFFILLAETLGNYRIVFERTGEVRHNA